MTKDQEEQQRQERIKFDLDRTVESYRQIKISLNRQTIVAATFILMGIAVHFLTGSSGDIFVSALGIKLEAKLASPVLIFFGSYLGLIRVLTLHSSVIFLLRVQKLYFGRFGELANDVYYSPPGLITNINRYGRAGFIGKVVSWLLALLIGAPLTLFAMDVQIEQFEGIGKYLLIASFFVWPITIALEFLSGYFGTKIFRSLEES